MSKKERLATSLEQLSDLCFTISGLVIEDSSEGGDIAKPSSSTLSPAAPVFKPGGKETSTPENKGSLPSDSSEDFEDWESVPELPSVSRDTPPTFSQVVGSSQSVFVTPIRRVVRAQSVDSVTSGVKMAVVVVRVPLLMVQVEVLHPLLTLLLRIMRRVPRLSSMRIGLQLAWESGCSDCC